MQDSSRKWGVIRAPSELIAEVDVLAAELEDSMAKCSSLKQQEAIKIEGGLSERFGVARWKLLRRLLDDHYRKRERQKSYRARKRSNNQFKD